MTTKPSKRPGTGKSEASRSKVRLHVARGELIGRRGAAAFVDLFTTQLPAVLVGAIMLAVSLQVAPESVTETITGSMQTFTTASVSAWLGVAMLWELTRWARGGRSVAYRVTGLVLQHRSAGASGAQQQVSPVDGWRIVVRVGVKYLPVVGSLWWWPTVTVIGAVNVVLLFAVGRCLHDHLSGVSAVKVNPPSRLRSR